MSEIRKIIVRTSGVRAILAGFVNLPMTGDEVSETAWFLTQEWNPLLADAMTKNPPNTTLGGFHEGSMGALIDLANKASEKYPDCDYVIQHGAYRIMRRSTGREQNVEVLLLTVHKPEAGRQNVVIIGDSSSLTLIPARDLRGSLDQTSRENPMEGTPILEQPRQAATADGSARAEPEVPGAVILGFLLYIIACVAAIWWRPLGHLGFWTKTGLSLIAWFAPLLVVIAVAPIVKRLSALFRSHE